MKKIPGQLTGSLILSVLIFSLASAEEQQNIAILPLESESISAKRVKKIFDKLTSELAKTNKYHIKEYADRYELLKTHKPELTWCTALECMIEIGTFLQVDIIVSGRIFKFNQNYLFTLRIISISQKKELGNVHENVTKGLDYLLTETIPLVAEKIAKSNVPPTKGIQKYKGLSAKTDSLNSTDSSNNLKGPEDKTKSKKETAPPDSQLHAKNQKKYIYVEEKQYKWNLATDLAVPFKILDKFYAYKLRLGIKYNKHYTGLVFGDTWKGTDEGSTAAFIGYGLTYSYEFYNSEPWILDVGCSLGWWNMSHNADFMGNIVQDYFASPFLKIGAGDRLRFHGESGVYIGTDSETGDAIMTPYFSAGITFLIGLW
ncbi:MAG: hypothetical protein HQK83_03550 [Fibrobacteria bacterium]|nr:hypothetical protein [Fibrobacteria bacterium]